MFKFVFKKWLKIYSSEEKYIIKTLISSMNYCKKAIEYKNQYPDRKEFFGYDYDHGICYNFEGYLKSILCNTMYNENYSFISELIGNMYKNYSNYSGERFYPIKSNDPNLTDRKFYHQEDKYTPELSEIRLELIKECKEFLEKL